MDYRSEFNHILRELVDDHLVGEYEKRGHAVVRNRAGYREWITFQGNRYNIPGMRCSYFINVGLELPALSDSLIARTKRGRVYHQFLGRQVAAVDAGKRVIWATRAEELVLSAPPEIVIGADTDRNELVQQLSALVPLISERLAQAYRPYRWLLPMLWGWDKVRSLGSRRGAA